MAITASTIAERTTGFRCVAGLLVGLNVHNYGDMVLCMKTTLDLPDELLIAAKKRAAELRRPLRSLVEEGLHHVLKGRRGTKSRNHKFDPPTVKGGLGEGLDLSNREHMWEWMRSKK